MFTLMEFVVQGNALDSLEYIAHFLVRCCFFLSIWRSLKLELQVERDVDLYMD